MIQNHLIKYYLFISYCLVAMATLMRNIGFTKSVKPEKKMMYPTLKHINVKNNLLLFKFLNNKTKIDNT